MINRILIRTKVVQMLYAYLLTRSEFKIEANPRGDSQDKKFAHAVYLDLLMLILEITGTDTRSLSAKNGIVAEPKLGGGKLVRDLAANPVMRKLMAENSNEDMESLRPFARELHDKIAESPVFKEYRRKRKITATMEADLWSTLMETTIGGDARLLRALRALPDYTGVGLSLAINQVTETLRSYSDTADGYLAAKDRLEDSLDKAYELYAAMFVLIDDLTRTEAENLENSRTKYLATASERNPNMRFVNNALVAKIRESESLENVLKDSPVSFEADTNLLNSLLSQIKSSELYHDYMAAESTDFDRDCEFWYNTLRNIVFPGDDLAEALEDKSVYWNDDLPVMGTFVLKTIKQLRKNPEAPLELLPKYKDEEDARFGAELFSDAVENREKYRAYIERFIQTDNWDPERMAFMDIVIMITAIAEIINYPAIPLAVTMNEYIEIANNYSSPKSGQFVNGILYKVVGALREDGLTVK